MLQILENAVPQHDKLAFSSLIYESNRYIGSVSQNRPKM